MILLGVILLILYSVFAQDASSVSWMKPVAWGLIGLGALFWILGRFRPVAGRRHFF